MKKAAFICITILMSVVITLIGLEVFTRIYLYLSPALSFKSHIEFRKSVPQPYEGAEYDVQEFSDESFNLPGWITPENTRLVKPLDFDGKYIHIKDGVRRTAFQPDNAENTIYLIGGSTVFCNEVPDEYTVSSYLQKKVNEKFGSKYKVQNLGASSVISSQELEWLKQLSLKPNDVVIFYDGANDVIQSIYNNDPDGWIIGKNLEIKRQAGKFKSLQIDLHTKYGKHSQFIDFFFSPYDYKYEPIHLSDPNRMGELKEKMKKNYLNSLTEAAQFSWQNNALFFHFLQPTLYSRGELSGYEVQLAGNYYLIGGGIQKSLEYGYPELEVISAGLTENNIRSHNLKNLFHDRQPNEEFFIDWVHLTHKGNQKVAEAIFDKIVNELVQI